MSKFFQDDLGNSSSLRLVWSITILTIVFTWSFISIKGGQLISFEIGDSLLMGLLFGGKVAQKYVEKIGVNDEKK